MDVARHQNVIEEKQSPNPAALGDSVTLCSQAARLLLESAQFLWVWISVWSLIGSWLMIHLDSRIHGHFLGKAFKKDEAKEREAEISQNVAMSMFSAPNPPPSFTMPPSPPSETYEAVRYLEQPATLQQALANEPLDDRTPEQAVQGAVYDQWHQYHGHIPLAIQPSFMAAPQSVYYGATITDAGQSIHNLSNLNGTHIITDPETGLPILVSGHLFTTIFEVPHQGSWYIEAPYPSEECLQRVLGQYSPAAGPPITFPDRSTSEPPLLTRLYQVPQAGWAIPVAQRAPPPESAAPVTIAASLVPDAMTSSEEVAASLFTGTTASLNESIPTPEYPGTLPPSALSPNPTEPRSATPSSEANSLPELVEISSEVWKEELAARIETALMNTAGIKRNEEHGFTFKEFGLATDTNEKATPRRGAVAPQEVRCAMEGMDGGSVEKGEQECTREKEEERAVRERVSAGICTEAKGGGPALRSSLRSEGQEYRGRIARGEGVGGQNIEGIRLARWSTCRQKIGGKVWERLSEAGLSVNQ
ncbi:hypothetical protein C8J57DRAFT_1211414 [Mycena rebaudengoi]|nr:hypothetical protein C8J57DRAFT_1211414 [Mycena rebaudengoi]